MRTSLAVLDFKTDTIEQVIDRVLDMAKAHNRNKMSMASLQSVLQKEQELKFWQAVQCITCLNPTYSTLECTMRMHCALCHSRAHTVDQCEYNLLNKVTALVRQIEPQDDRPPRED